MAQARISVHKASAFIFSTTFPSTTKGLIISLNSKSYPGPSFPGCLLHSWSFLIVDSGSCAQNKGFWDPQECWLLLRSLFPPTSDTSIKYLPAQRLRFLGSLFNGSPPWTSPQPLANNIFIPLPYLGFKSRKLAQTSPHHFPPDKTATAALIRAAVIMFKISHIYVFINRFESIENNTKIYPAGLKGDVEFLSLLAVISHLANPHFKKKKRKKRGEISAVEKAEGCFTKAAFLELTYTHTATQSPSFYRGKHAFFPLLYVRKQRSGAGGASWAGESGQSRLRGS